jgi:VDE lipocalin domain
MTLHQNQKLEFPVSKFAEAKELYVAAGSHPIYDCFDCQKLEFNQREDGGVQVRWSTVTKSREEIRDAHYILYQDTKNSLVTHYELFGMPVEEHYYMLDFTEEYFLYFYCGFGFKGEYQGSVVYSKSKGGLPDEIATRFQKVLDNANLKDYIPATLDGFCRPSYQFACKNI